MPFPWFLELPVRLTRGGSCRSQQLQTHPEPGCKLDIRQGSPWFSSRSLRGRRNRGRGRGARKPRKNEGDWGEGRGNACHKNPI